MKLLIHAFNSMPVYLYFVSKRPHVVTWYLKAKRTRSLAGIPFTNMG